MFGITNPFGQSSSSPFSSLSVSSCVTGSEQSVFGRTVGVGIDPFKLFSSSRAPFGSKRWSGEITGFFWEPPTPTFGALSAPAFGSSVPAFGASSTPSFGSSSSSFGGSSLFGQKPAFGAFGSSPSQSSPFGSTFQQTQPAFGSNVFVFGSTSPFGASQPAFGASTTPAFGASSTPAFGATTAPGFGAATAPGFGAQSTTPTFGSPGFGQPTFGGQAGGSRIEPCTPTPEVDGGTGTQPARKLESISAMPVYKDKSHEELRCEDYRRGDKGGPNPSGQPASGISFPAPTQSCPFGAAGTFGQSAANPSNPFALKTPAFGSTGFGSSSTSLFSSPFSSSSTAGPFRPTSSAATVLYNTPYGPAYGISSSSSLFGGTTTPAFGSSSTPSIFGSSMAGSASSFGSGLTFENAQSSGLFLFPTPAFGQTSAPFGQTSTGFQQTSPAFGSNLFNTPSTGFGGSLFSSKTPSQFPWSSTPTGVFGQTTVPEKPAPVRRTLSMFSPRHQSQIRIKLPPRRHNLKPDGSKARIFIKGSTKCREGRCIPMGRHWYLAPLAAASIFND